MWLSWTHFFLVAICFVSFRPCMSQVSLTLCTAPVKGQLCVLTCETTDLNGNIFFKINNVEVAKCTSLPGLTPTCSPTVVPGYDISQSAPKTTYLNISSLSRGNDGAVWSCEYGTSSDSKTLTVLTEPSPPFMISGYESVDFNDDADKIVNITLVVSCCSPITVVPVLYESGSENRLQELTATNSATCPDTAETTYTYILSISRTAYQSDTLISKSFQLKFEIQLVNNIGTLQTVLVPNTTFTFEAGATKIDKCACVVTPILGAFLCIPFILLFDAIFMLVIYFAKDNEIFKKCKEKIAFTILTVCIVLLVSGVLGGVVTYAVMSGKDTGYKSTGCKCMEYIGVLVSLGFSVLGSVVTSAIIYVFMFGRKEDGSVCSGLIFGECFDKVQRTRTCAVTPDKEDRKPGDGKETSNSVNENDKTSAKTDNTTKKPEKPTNDYVAPPKDSLLDNVRPNRPLPTGRNPAVLLPEVEKESIELYNKDAKQINDDAPKKSKKGRKKKKSQAIDDFEESKDTVGDENIKEAETNVKREKRKRKKKRNVLKDPDVSEPNYEKH